MKINLTPIIDIVFLLIIFLIVVSQGMNTEKIQVSLPADCDYAGQLPNKTDAVTVTALKDSNSPAIIFAVGSEEYRKTGDTAGQLSKWLVKQIKAGLKKSRSKILLLRIDKDITYQNAQYILSAAAASGAGGMEIAAEKQPLFHP